LSELAKHGAYTVHIPVWLGRVAGVTEMLCALSLLAGLHPRWRMATKWGAIYVFVNQIVAGSIHIIYAEFHALPANARWMAIAALLYFLCAPERTKPSLAGGLE
jgi:uncharacterized membrane protein